MENTKTNTMGQNPYSMDSAIRSDDKIEPFAGFKMPVKHDSSNIGQIFKKVDNVCLIS